MRILLYLLIFLSGFVDSIAGGGSIISLTSYLAFGIPPHMALGTNKFSAVLGTSVSTLRFAQKGHIQWEAAGIAFAGALGGSALGANLALFVPSQALVYIMLLVLPAIAFIVLRGKSFAPRNVSLARKRLLPYALLIGFAIGGYDGFFGPGAGTFMIMAFIGILGFDILTACGSAKFVTVASNFGALVTFIINKEVDYTYGIPCAIVSVLGQYIGSGLAMKKGVHIVRPMILVVITCLMVKIVSDVLM